MEYGYDAQGNLTSALQCGPGVGTVLTSLSHDLRGRKTAMTGPDHGTWIYVDNAFGELVRQTDAKQQITTATFDRAGRLIRRDHYGAGESPASVQPLDRAVDLVDLRSAGVLVTREALTHGRRLFCKDERAFVEVLSRMVTDAEDFLPLRRRMLAERRDAWLR